jgi:ribose-phosphate pyrophosphokinase
MAQAYAQALMRPLAIVAKRRISPTEIEAVNVIGEVEGKHVFLIDDLTETAGTLCSAAKLLSESGARRFMRAYPTRSSATSPSRRLKNSSLRELICTNSVPVRDGEGFRITPLVSPNCSVRRSSAFTATSQSHLFSKSAKPKSEPWQNNSN